MIWLGLSVA